MSENRDLNKEGVGLGLMISKNIAKALGGDIRVNSKLGLGSRFTLELPLGIRLRRGNQEISSSYISVNELDEKASTISANALSIMQDSFEGEELAMKEFFSKESSNAGKRTQPKKMLSRAFENKKENDIEAGEDHPISPCHCSRVLVADDEPFNIVALAGVLEMLGVADVDKAYNGQEALDAVTRN